MAEKSLQFTHRGPPGNGITARVSGGDFIDLRSTLNSFSAWASEIAFPVGADRAMIITLVSRRALMLTGTGLATGVITDVAISRLLTGLLYGARALDVEAYCLGAGSVLLVMIFAAWLPGWRASQVDPAITLRNG